MQHTREGRGKKAFTPAVPEVEEADVDSPSMGWVAGKPIDIPQSIAEKPSVYFKNLSTQCSASDAFLLYFDEEVWENIVSETNLYAVQSGEAA